MALSHSDASELLEVFRAGEGVDLIRESVRLVMQDLIEVDAAEHIGAGRKERTETRTTQRHESRPKVAATQAGDVELAIPKLPQIVPHPPFASHDVPVRVPRRHLPPRPRGGHVTIDGGGGRDWGSPPGPLRPQPLGAGSEVHKDMVVRWFDRVRSTRHRCGICDLGPGP